MSDAQRCNLRESRLPLGSNAGGETHRIAACTCKPCMLAWRSPKLTGHLKAPARIAARRASTGGQIGDAGERRSTRRAGY
eukprot:5467739-Pleurochrysis_carterae.AAC.1